MVQGNLDMELSNVERALPPRPQAQGAGVPAPAKSPSSPPVPEGVINDIDPQVQALALRDRLAPTQAAEDQPAWASVPERPTKPPQETLSKMLMAHLHLVWTASARVVDQARVVGNDKNLMRQELVQAQAQHRNVDPAEVPGSLAKASLTYTPGKVKKVDTA